MERPIAYNLLNKDELVYEVTIREAKPEASVAALRSQLKELVQSLPADEVVESHLDSQRDLKEVGAGMEELRLFFANTKVTFKKFNRVRALSHYLFHRLSRIEPTSEETLALHTKLEAELGIILPKVDSLFTSYNISFDKANHPVDEVQLDSRPLEKQLKSITLLQHKYGGTTCVRTYLQRLDELCVARRISVEALFQGAVELFTHHALVWFRGVKDLYDSWVDLRQALLEEFLPVDFDKRLLIEIRNRTQGPAESSQHFINSMLNYFTRLTVPVGEAERLNIIQYNLRPSFVRALALEVIPSLSCLKMKCRMIENSIARAADFHEPPKSSEHTLAPDLAYPHSRTNPKLELVESRPLFCVRCRIVGHLLKDCKSNEVVCYTCGKKGFTSSTCPDCVKKVGNISKNE